MKQGNHLGKKKGQNCYEINEYSTIQIRNILEENEIVQEIVTEREKKKVQL